MNSLLQHLLAQGSFSAGEAKPVDNEVNSVRTEADVKTASKVALHRTTQNLFEHVEESANYIKAQLNMDGITTAFAIDKRVGDAMPEFKEKSKVLCDDIPHFRG